ncbi:MAG: formylglycine-generating enzyme family protein [Verrucomicrobia bacterium]|nr:formylglycine-generating enzyme family protein [Verrucomicrobiota bacterium]
MLHRAKMIRATTRLLTVALGTALGAVSTTFGDGATPERLIAREGAEMVLVPAGPFVMGSLDGDADEAPPRQVTLAAFYIDRFEVTHARYAAFVKATGHKPLIDWPSGVMPAKLANHPVVNVTWADADAYARWVGKRLPTEAEWEKAARGTNGQVYPWGNSAAGKKAASGEDAKDKTHPEGRTFPVGSFPDDASPYGAMDMAGNVWEWTADWYTAYPGSDHLELEFGKKFKVIRGGGAIDYYGAASTRRCADRARSAPYGRYDALGFRCVMETKENGQ